MRRACTFLFLMGSGWAQVLQPNLSQKSDTVTTSGRQADIVNTSSQAIAWRLTFWYTGFTAVTAQIDCAPDNGSGGPGTYAACTGAFDGTSNPQAISATPQGGTIAVKTFTPHVAVNFTRTGAGKIHYLLVGYVGTNVSPSTISTSGGGGNTPVSLTCNAQAEVALSGTAYTSIIAASGATTIKICNIAVTSASGGNPTVNTFTGAFGVCGSSPTEVFNIAGVTGYTDQFYAGLAGTSGQAFCVKEAVANSDKVTVTYVQQ